MSVVWRLPPEEVSQVQHPNCITSGPFEFLDKLVQVDLFRPKSHGNPHDIRIFSDQQLTLRCIGRFFELARIRGDGGKPSMSESIGQFQWSGGGFFHLAPGLIEITLHFGVEQVADPLVKQALQMQSTSYDVVLPFNSLAKFLETRHISLLQKATSELDIGKKQSVRVIAIVGLFEKGKTWLINKLFGINLPSGTLHETDGLSFLWIPERRMLLIDSAGVQSPVAYCSQTGEGSEQSVDDALFDAKSTESFLFDMISRMASHMVFVVNSFTSLEQQYVEMLRRKYVARQVHKELIVVHNMINVKDAEVAHQLFEKQVTTCYSGDLSTMGQLIFTAKKDKGPPVHHIGLCYESSPAGDAFNDKNRQYLLQSLEHRESETEMVLQDQLREHLSELLKMFVSTEIPEQAAASERAFGIDFRPGSELTSSAEEQMPKGYVCGGVFSLQLDKGAEPKMRTRGVISPLGELIGYDATFEPNVNVYEETTDAGVQRKILIECPGVAMEDIELDDESLSAGFQLAITKRALIDEQAVRKVDGWPFRQQQGRWERAFLVDLTAGKFEDPVMELRQDGILEITMKKKQKKGIARLGYKSDRVGPAAAPSESAASSWIPVSVQGQQQESPEQLGTAGV
ncbi:unnamed protein product [Symbiodinium necroappetens]|uniref:Guanylate-binding protein N-terminal domain-containing protein n=1 Tax=Symbiodinium necroappetens TaxID=1628268 RepID=A0A812ZGL2_9DINO|nr:unnamed protein product [Symbiodinium necroappetens]